MSVGGGIVTSPTTSDIISQNDAEGIMSDTVKRDINLFIKKIYFLRFLASTKYL